MDNPIRCDRIIPWRSASCSAILEPPPRRQIFFEHVCSKPFADDTRPSRALEDFVRPRSPLPLLRPTNGSAAETLLTERSQTRYALRIRLDFCRKGRIAMCVGRWIWLPAGALRARRDLRGF